MDGHKNVEVTDSCIIEPTAYRALVSGGDEGGAEGALAPPPLRNLGVRKESRKRKR